MAKPAGGARTPPGRQGDPTNTAAPTRDGRTMRPGDICQTGHGRGGAPLFASYQELPDEQRYGSAHRN